MIKVPNGPYLVYYFECLRGEIRYGLKDRRMDVLCWYGREDEKVRMVRYIHVSYARKLKHTVTTIPQ